MKKEKEYLHIGRRKIVVVSTFSGMDLFLLGCVKAGLIPGYALEKNFWACLLHQATFKNSDGTPLIEFINISSEEYEFKKNHVDENGRKDMEDEIGIIDGQHVRTKLIQEVDGRDIRAAIEARYGKDVIIILVGGPPCTDYTKINFRKNLGQTSRNFLVFQYLRILEELNPDVALMEEVTDFASPNFKPIFDEFIARSRKLPYRFAIQKMCSTHYGGNQLRWRMLTMYVHIRWNTDPVFPQPDLVNVKRVCDFLDIDYFHSGHFTDAIKTKDHFMCTVTSGSPTWFWKNGVKRKPTIDELLLCMDVEKGEYIIPEGIPQQEILKAIGNGVCVSVGYALAKTIIEKVLRLRPDGDGYFVPIDDNPTEPDDSPDGIAPADPAPTVGDPDNQPPMDTQSPPAAEPSATEPSTPVKFHESGFVLWKGKSLINGDNIVAVITLSSANEKTGDMAQLFMLNADVNPIEAVETGKDESVCGKCPFRHYLGGACYVPVWKYPFTVWKAWKNGAYPFLPAEHYNVLKGLAIRLGSYGDPAAIPASVINGLKEQANNYTGYTHQWQVPAASHLKSTCMASVDNPDEYRKANEMGWRTFRVIKEGDPLMPGEILCPNETNGVQCHDCKLCSGTSLSAKNIAIHVHGTHRNRFNPATSATNNVKVISPRIINSSELRKMNFKCWHFEEPWYDFIGQPSMNFHAVLSGMAGEGKSTLAIQLAKYVSEEFGRTIYISGEEGFSKTFKDKFLMNDVESEFLDVADLRTFEDILRNVPRDMYRFIFIDSLNNMKIDPPRLRKLKAVYKDAAFITISQSTKQGQIRGSYEVVHDADIAIIVRNGIAETTKNRFREKNKQYRIFRTAKVSENFGSSSCGLAPEPGIFASSLGALSNITLVQLTRMLKDAIAVENYELCKTLRDEIEKRNNKSNIN